MINIIENSLCFGAALSLAGYEVGLLLKKKFKMALFNPLLIWTMVFVFNPVASSPCL